MRGLKLLTITMCMLAMGCEDKPKGPPPGIPVPKPRLPCNDPPELISVPCRVIVVLHTGTSWFDPAVGHHGNFGCRLSFAEMDRLLDEAAWYLEEKARIRLAFECTETGVDIKVFRVNLSPASGQNGDIRKTRTYEDFQARELFESRYGNDDSPVPVYDSQKVNIFFTGNIVWPGASEGLLLYGLNVDPRGGWISSPRIYPYIFINDGGGQIDPPDVATLSGSRALTHELGHFFLRKHGFDPYDIGEHLPCSPPANPCEFLMSASDPPVPEPAGPRMNLFLDAAHGHCEPTDMWQQAQYFQCTCPPVTGCDYHCLPWPEE